MTLFPKIHGVILDWGGVICEDPSPGFIRYCSLHLGVDSKALALAVSHHIHDFMRGTPEPAFWKNVGDELGLSLLRKHGIAQAYESLWGKALAAVYVPIQETLDIARELTKRGIRMGLLTNTEPPSKIFHLSQGYDFFVGRVFSCDEGIIKPQAEIYRLAAQRLGLDPQECLMVDDRAENIEGAAQVNMLCHQFSNPAELRRSLIELGILA